MDIKDLLKRFKLRNVDLSTLTGISQGRIAGWKSGDGSPKEADQATLEETEKILSGKTNEEIQNLIAEKKKKTPTKKGENTPVENKETSVNLSFTKNDQEMTINNFLSVIHEAQQIIKEEQSQKSRLLALLENAYGVKEDEVKNKRVG